MSKAARSVMTLDQLRDVIKSDEDLPGQTRSELTSAITRFCAICTVEPSHVLADPAAIRTLLGSASWQVAGLSRQSWSNIRSRLTRAMSHGGIGVARRRRNTRLLPVWDELLATLSADQAKRLRRFAGFCSARQIAPLHVTEQTFGDFLEFLETQSVQRHVRERWHEGRRAWNKTVAVTGSEYPEIPNTAPARWKSRSWEEFPVGFRREVDAWSKYLSRGDLTENRDALRPATIKNYVGAVRRFVSLLADDGVSPDQFGSQSALFEPGLLKRGLTLLQKGRELDEARPTLHLTAQALMSVARFIELDPGEPGYEAQQKQFALIRKVAAKVRGQPLGMVRKNRDRLAKLSSPTAARMFRNLHRTVAARFKGVKQPTLAEAREMQMAALFVFLMDLPVRVKNAAALDLARHVTRPPGGKPGPWRIAFPGSEMKNGRPFESELGLEASAFLEDYLARFRPVICKVPSTAVFPSSQTGRAKSEEALSRQFSGFVFRELGLKVNPHLMRHHAGMTWLDHMPGEYMALSKLLGHSSVTTTERSYTGAEIASAQNRYHGMLDEMRARDRAQDAALQKSRSARAREAVL